MLRTKRIVLALALAGTALLPAACLPTWVSFGPDGQVGTWSGVYRLERGELTLDTRAMRAIRADAEGMPTSDDHNFHTAWSPEGELVAVFHTFGRHHPTRVIGYELPSWERAWDVALPAGFPFEPRFSADGRWLAVVQSDEEADVADLWVIDREGGKRRLANNTAAFFDWEPGGQRIAVALGGGADLQGDLSLGTLSLIDAETGEAKPLVGIAMSTLTSVRCADDGSIDVLMREVTLPITRDEASKDRGGSVYRVRGDGSGAEVVLPAAAFGDRRIWSFRRAPGGAERYAVITADEDPGDPGEVRFSAWLVETGGDEPRLQRVEDAQPVRMAIPFWRDAGTWGFPAQENTVWFGRVGGEGEPRSPDVHAGLWGMLGDWLTETDAALTKVATLQQALREAREEPGHEQEESLRALDRLVTEDETEAGPRALAALLLGLYPDRPSGRAALEQAKRDPRALSAAYGDARVGDMAALALTRLETGEPYPRDAAPIIGLIE
jgi:hypothetical protein